MDWNSGFEVLVIRVFGERVGVCRFRVGVCKLGLSFVLLVRFCGDIVILFIGLSFGVVVRRSCNGVVAIESVRFVETEVYF